eukprot:gene21262-25541_t
MPRYPLLTEAHLPHLKMALTSQTMSALSVTYGVSLSTIGNFLRRHGVLPKYDGWRSERYDRMLAATISRVSIGEVAAISGTNTAEVQLRLRELIDSIKAAGFTLQQLAILTGIDRVYWRDYIGAGWLRRPKAGRIARVPVEDLLNAVRGRPELFEYRNVPELIARALGVFDLPDPPSFKMVTCRSLSIEARIVDIPAGDEGPRIKFGIQSCGALGGVDLWVPTYAIATCPRCGLRVSRLSEKQVYAKSPGDSAHVKNAMASKIGLSWKSGRFESMHGQVMDRQALSGYVSRISLRNTRDRERRLKLIEDIERYDVAGRTSIL